MAEKLSEADKHAINGNFSAANSLKSACEADNDVHRRFMQNPAQTAASYGVSFVGASLEEADIVLRAHIEAHGMTMDLEANPVSFRTWACFWCEIIIYFMIISIAVALAAALAYIICEYAPPYCPQAVGLAFDLIALGIMEGWQMAEWLCQKIGYCE